MHDLAEDHLGIRLRGDPKDVAHFLAFVTEGEGEFELEGHAALNIPIVLPLHRGGIEHAPLEVGDVIDEFDFGEGFVIDVAGAIGGGGRAFEDFVFVIAQDDGQKAAAAAHGRELDGFGDARLAAPGEAERDVLEG